MASFNSVHFLTLLVAILAFMAAPTAVEAQLITNSIINITGNVRCATNAALFPNGTLSGNPFPNATVQLRCGNTTTASNTTNSNGTFILTIDPPGGPLVALITYVTTVLTCRAVVTTPLSSCNSTLPANGTLASALKMGSINRAGNTRIYTVLAKAFTT